MSEESSRQKPKRRLQVPLWFLLFVVPSVIAVGCAVYAAWDRETRIQAELSVQFAVATQETMAAETWLARLKRLDAALVAKHEEWQNVDRVLLHVQHPPPSVPGLPNPGHEFVGLPLVHPSIHFYVQAGDGDLRQLVARLTEIYSAADLKVQYRVLDCLKKLPSHVEADRLGGIRSVVQEFVEPLQEHQHPVIRAQAQSVLRAFDLPVKETGRNR